MTSKADKLPLETEPVARDNNSILTLKPVDQTLSRLTQLIIVVVMSWSEVEFTILYDFSFPKVRTKFLHTFTFLRPNLVLGRET